MKFKVDCMLTGSNPPSTLGVFSSSSFKSNQLELPFDVQTFNGEKRLNRLMPMIRKVCDYSRDPLVRNTLLAKICEGLREASSPQNQ